MEEVDAIGWQSWTTVRALDTGHLTGCSGADLHNSPTASSVSLGHFSS